MAFLVSASRVHTPGMTGRLSAHFTSHMRISGSVLDDIIRSERSDQETFDIGFR